MKKLLSFLSITLLAGTVFTACEKVKDLPYYDNGNAVTITTNRATLVPTPADSNVNVVNFAWTSPKYASDASSWKFVLEVDSTGRNFSKSFKKTFIGTTNGSLTGGELNNIMLNYGFNLGSPYTLDVRVWSSYGNNNERYSSNTITITVTPYTDPSILTTQNTSVTGSLNTATQHSNSFTWTKAFNSYSGAVTYTLQYDSAGKNFASLKEIAVGQSIFTKALTVSEMNETALNEGVAGGTTGKIEYRIKAQTAQGAIAYSNAVSVTIGTYVPFYKFYLVGSPNGWNINSPWELISDRGGSRWGKVFYTYARLNAGDAFLFVKTVGDWNSKHGSTGGGTNGIYDIGAPGTGSDFTVSASGIYRITIDLNANKAYIQQKQVGLVGGMQGWNPASPVFGGLVQRDQFLIISPSSGTDAFKFHDGPAWDNSAPDKARWWGRGASAGLLDTDGNGPDIVANTSPRTRAIWDGTDPQQLKYELSPASEMRVVGDGINGVNAWDPGSSPTMTYAGNGVWTVTLSLLANKDIKFLAGNAWGAFDYEDDSNQSQATGTPRKIKWSGGNNFKTPATAGTYTITLDEHAQTLTIN